MVPSDAVNNNTVEEVCAYDNNDNAQLEVMKDAFLGKGQYGSTFKAKMNDKIVAVKQPFRNELKKNEIDMLKSVRHKNIVKFLGCFMCNKKFCITMELAESGNLYTVLHDQRRRTFDITSDLKDQWIREVACGLEYLHNGLDNPILHGDVKSPNVLIFKEPTYTAKLSDFGLSEEMLDGTYTVDGGGTFSAPWAAPEAVKSKRTIKSDVWSFGALTWEILMEKVPHHNLNQSYFTIIFAVGRGDTPYNPATDGICDKYRTLLNNCFSLDHHNRWSFTDILRYLDYGGSYTSEEEPTDSCVASSCGWDDPKKAMSAVETDPLTKEELYNIAIVNFTDLIMESNADRLKRMKHIFKDKLPRGVFERISDAYGLISRLEKMALLSCDDIDFFVKRLSMHGEQDLAKKFQDDCQPKDFDSNSYYYASSEAIDTVQLRNHPLQVRFDRKSSDTCINEPPFLGAEGMEASESSGHRDTKMEVLDVMGSEDIENISKKFNELPTNSGQIDTFVTSMNSMDQAFDVISNRVTNDSYYTLARHLLGSQTYFADVKAIELQVTDLRQRTHCLLELWYDRQKKREDREPTLERLVTYLNAAKLKRTASEVEKLMSCSQ